MKLLNLLSVSLDELPTLRIIEIKDKRLVKYKYDGK
jgi:hypothetical protein